MAKRKKFILSEKQKHQIKIMGRQHDNTYAGIARKTGVPIYHVNKILDEELGINAFKEKL